MFQHVSTLFVFGGIVRESNAQASCGPVGASYSVPHGCQFGLPGGSRLLIWSCFHLSTFLPFLPLQHVIARKFLAPQSAQHCTANCKVEHQLPNLAEDQRQKLEDRFVLFTHAKNMILATGIKSQELIRKHRANQTIKSKHELYYIHIITSLISKIFKFRFEEIQEQNIYYIYTQIYIYISTTKILSYKYI